MATLIAFAFSGYGMFRLTRTLTGSNAAAWIAALVFAFVPYHFQRLPHLPLIFAGWIPLMLEALILFGARAHVAAGNLAWLGISNERADVHLLVYVDIGAFCFVRHVGSLVVPASA
jgi:hypothetical protein